MGICVKPFLLLLEALEGTLRSLRGGVGYQGYEWKGEEAVGGNAWALKPRLLGGGYGK